MGNGQISISIDTRLQKKLSVRAAELGISLSALCAAYIENGLSGHDINAMDSQTEALMERFEHLAQQVESSIKQLKTTPANGSQPPAEKASVSSIEMKAFFLETLLYLRTLYKNDVATQSAIAKQVIKHYGEDNRVKGL